MLTLTEGSSLGRYTLLTRLARGGMADVWLARAEGAEGFQKTVVLKTILPELANDPEFVSMFVNEALMASNLDHPNIVRIYDFGQIEGSYCIAMEYIAGRTLRHIQNELALTKRVPPPWLVLHMATEVCDALQYAQEKPDASGRSLNLVHRDISPENVIIAFSGETKVLDFGIAKPASSPTKTVTGVFKGKYPYMAPEQVEDTGDGNPPGPRADLYALGIVMYELITGRRPFRGTNELALIHQILSADPEPPASFCPWVPAALSDLVLKAMARDPSQRFRCAAEMHAAIETYLSTTGAIPTRRHMADYLRGLFGETGPATTATGEALASEVTTGRHTLIEDPWDCAEGPPSTAKEPYLTIDLSLLIAGLRGSSPPPPQKDLSALGRETPQFSAIPKTPEAPRSAPNSMPYEDELDAFAEWWPAPSPEPVAVTLTEEPPPQSIRAGRSKFESASEIQRGPHLWDELTRRAKEPAPGKGPQDPKPDPKAQQAAVQPPQSANAWDGAIESTKRGARHAPATAQTMAAKSFEEGLAKLRTKDLEGALACWSQAAALDPDNRLYQSNLRVLRKQIAEKSAR